jgi:uncharacterized protein (TIGR03437 family)
MNFTVATRTLSGGPWLSATPKSGAATNGVNTPTITVSINQAGLGPGIYYGLVRIDSAAAANTPRLVTVVLRVLPADADPGPDIEPSELVFTAVQGATSPGSKNLLIYNVSGTPQTYVSSIVASDPNDLFNFVPDNATLSLTAPTKLVMQPITTGLAPGVYEAELTLQFSDGYIQRAVIRTIVTPAPPGSSNTPFEGRDTTACTPTQLVPVVTTLGQAFGIPATWPVSVEAEVHDDCGNTLENGSVKVSFSNGDVPLSLQVLPGGFWHTTWLSGQAAGPVTLTLTATDPARNLTGTREVTGGLGDPSGAPILGAAVSAASNSASTPLAPLSIISLYGQDLADSSYMLAPALPLGTTLAGASVVMAGNLLPLIFAANGQINAVVSTGINTNTNHQILVQRDNTISIPISVDVAPAEPAIFGYPLPGDPPTQGAVVNAITGVVTHPGTPATAGDILAIYCTGLGAVDQNLADGAGAPSSPLANTATLPIVTIGGKDAKVAFSGLAPTYVGLYQIDATVPPGVTPGNQVPIVISIAGQTSPTSPPVTIAVK